MKFNLKTLEDNLQTFFEEHLQLFGNSDPIFLMSKDLLIVMEDNIKLVDSDKYLPNIYRISIKEKSVFESDQLEIWKQFITEVINDTTKTNHLNLSGPIHIQFFLDPNLEKDFQFDVAHSTFSSGKTIRIPTEKELTEIDDESIHAYLITPYDSIFSIRKKIINIGRHEDNELVLDNLRISRVHAQIREINGKHILFDLDSTTGTKINGHRINQYTLSAGDVIEIGDVPLIYNIEMENEQASRINDSTRSFKSLENTE